MSATLVIGGTGAMGGRVVRRLVASGHVVRVLTRNPGAPHAQRMIDLGSGRVDLVRGDVGDIDSVRRAMAGAGDVFCNTDFFSTGSPVGEYEQGMAVLEAAREAGIERFVWSSLDSAVALTQGRTPVPHYDSKAAVAARINLLRSEEMMRREQRAWYTDQVSILTTAPYFENLQTKLAPRSVRLRDGRRQLLFSIPLGTGRYPLIALDDIAFFAEFMFENWQSWGGRDLAVVGDSLTGPEIAATFERVTGLAAGYANVPLDVLRDSDPDVGHDFANMFEFFQGRDLCAHDRDLSQLRQLHPGLMAFGDWLDVTGWRGDEQGDLASRRS